MSNYPPGVTGNELEIAGYDEREMYVECQKEVKLFVVDQALKSKLASLKIRVEGSTTWGSLKENPDTIEACHRQLAYLKKTVLQLNRDVYDLPTVEVACPFEDEVMVYAHPSVGAHWACPVCDTEHEYETDEAE